MKIFPSSSSQCCFQQIKSRLLQDDHFHTAQSDGEKLSSPETMSCQQLGYNSSLRNSSSSAQRGNTQRALMSADLRNLSNLFFWHLQDFQGVVPSSGSCKSVVTHWEIAVWHKCYMGVEQVWNPKEERDKEIMHNSPPACQKIMDSTLCSYRNHQAWASLFSTSTSIVAVLE